MIMTATQIKKKSPVFRTTLFNVSVGFVRVCSDVPVRKLPAKVTFSGKTVCIFKNLSFIFTARKTKHEFQISIFILVVAADIFQKREIRTGHWILEILKACRIPAGLFSFYNQIERTHNK